MQKYSNPLSTKDRMEILNTKFNIIHQHGKYYLPYPLTLLWQVSSVVAPYKVDLRFSDLVHFPTFS